MPLPDQDLGDGEEIDNEDDDDLEFEKVWRLTKQLQVAADSDPDLARGLAKTPKPEPLTLTSPNGRPSSPSLPPRSPGSTFPGHAPCCGTPQLWLAGSTTPTTGHGRSSISSPQWPPSTRTRPTRSRAIYLIRCTEDDGLIAGIQSFEYLVEEVTGRACGRPMVKVYHQYGRV